MNAVARLYNSTSLQQKLIATVEGITADGHYDLDVKKSADPKNISPYVDARPKLHKFSNSYGKLVQDSRASMCHKRLFLLPT